MHVDHMDNPHLDTILNLKIVSRVRAFDRLDTTSPIFRIRNASYLVPQWLYRWWTHSSRAHDVSRLEVLYKNAFDICSSDDRGLIMNDLEQSLTGLKALSTTYEDDATIQSRIEVIIDGINHVLGQEGNEEDETDREY